MYEVDIATESSPDWAKVKDASFNRCYDAMDFADRLDNDLIPPYKVRVRDTDKNNKVIYLIDLM